MRSLWLACSLSILSLLALLFFLKSAASAPAVINVPGDAATITAAIKLATTGDTVLVAPGIYTENLVITKTITLASYFMTTGDPTYITNTIIDGQDQSEVILVQEVGPEAAIVGFTLQNADDGVKAYSRFNFLHNHIHGTSDGIDYEGGGGLCAFNVFEDNDDDGIDLDGPFSGVIEHNIIRRNGYLRDGSIKRGSDGIEIRLNPYTGPVAAVTIRHNTIQGNADDGIQFIDYANPANHIYRIERNLILGNRLVGIGFMGGENTIEDEVGHNLDEIVIIANNIISGNNNGLTGGGNVVLLNNIVLGNTEIGVKNTGGNAAAAYNLFWQNGTDAQGSNFINSLFANPLLGSDFRPQPSSPAIDAGIASYDWQGQSVLALTPADYAGVAPDIGVFEAVSADLALRLTAANATPLFPGAPVTFTLHLTNTGNLTATNLTLAHEIPPQLTNISPTSWQLAALPPNASTQLTVTAIISPLLDSSVNITYAASISTNTYEARLANNRAEAALAITVPQVGFTTAAFRGGRGNGRAIITLALSNPNPYAPTYVTYATVDGTATAGSDYTAVTGTLTLPAGSTGSSFILPLLPPNGADGKTIQLTLSNPQGAALGRASATLTLTDDFVPLGSHAVLLPLINR